MCHVSTVSCALCHVSTVPCVLCRLSCVLSSLYPVFSVLCSLCRVSFILCRVSTLPCVLCPVLTVSCVLCLVSCHSTLCPVWCVSPEARGPPSTESTEAPHCTRAVQPEAGVTHPARHSQTPRLRLRQQLSYQTIFKICIWLTNTKTPVVVSGALPVCCEPGTS